MSLHPFRPLVFATAVSLLTIASSGCSSSSDSPTAPGAGGLTIEASSTAVQMEPGGHRLQLRLRVLQGTAALQDAVQQGGARAETCLGSTCVEQALGDFMEASCPAMGAAEVWIGSAWMSGNEVGVDVCVANAAGVTIETSVVDGFSRSNAVRTSCAMSGGLLLCGSD